MLNRALVVDDDPAIRRLMQKLLEREEFSVNCAKDGSEAIDLLREGDYEVVFLDLMMPRVSGHEVIDWIRQDRPAIISRIIVVTAQRENELRDAQGQGIYAVVHKPFDIADVIKLARECAAAGSTVDGTRP